MNKTKYRIIISTDGVTLEEMPEILEQIRNSFTKGYVVGSASNDMDHKSYDFETTEV